jgi:hypothetical protein
MGGPLRRPKEGVRFGGLIGWTNYRVERGGLFGGFKSTLVSTSLLLPVSSNLTCAATRHQLPLPATRGDRHAKLKRQHGS